MPVLTGVDIQGVQRYVFASNRLRDVFCASFMVDHVTSPKTLSQWSYSKPAEVLLGAGGNAVLLFESEPEAKRWTGYYSRFLLDEAPELTAVVAHLRYEAGSLAQALQDLQEKLARAKLERSPHALQLGLSVTASCSVTGQPATALDMGALVGRQVQRLRARRSEATQRWARYLAEPTTSDGLKVAFPSDHDQLGRTADDTSLLGVVHVDGNAVGQAIKDWLKGCIENELDDGTVRAQYAAWSKDIVTLGDHILRTLVARVQSRVVERADHPGRWLLQGTPEELSFELNSDGDALYLPIRPILLGGDDLTFVCDGRIAMDLATVAVETFGLPDCKVRHLGPNGAATSLSACAGVALVHTHAPFYRSYELAAQLCESAKKKRTATKSNNSWVDWHIGTVRPSEPLERLRARQYQAPTSEALTMRPYPIPAQRRTQSWTWLQNDLLAGLRGDSMWKGSRSRVKRLLSLVDQGPAHVQRQLNAWRASSDRAAPPAAEVPAETASAMPPSDAPHPLALPGGLPDTGFIGEATPLRDAIELLDLHLQLDAPPEAPPMSTPETEG